jgi:hypothetical protein
MPLFLSNGSKLKKTDLVEVMKLRNIIELEEIDIKEECSSHIYVHQLLFESLTAGLPPHSVCFVKLTNCVSQHVYCNIYASHTNSKSVVYAPHWILVALEGCHETIVIEVLKPSMCTGLVLQPHTSISLESLRVGIENYSCLRAGGTYKLWNPGRAKSYTLVSVLETMPHSFDYLCILNCDINLELRKALDTTESDAPNFFTIDPRKTTPPPDWSKMKGHTLRSVDVVTQSSRDAMLLAALRRLNSEGHKN